VQIQDAIHASMVKEGFTTGNREHYQDALVVWLNTNVGVASDDLSTAWNQYWDAQTIPAGNYNDRYKTWLASLGFAQNSLPDAQLAYWTNRSI